MARDLHQERLGTTDESGNRIFLFPEEIKGKFRNYRSLVYWILIPLFLTLPWINIGEKQSILLDIVKREFTFFGTTFYGHDTPLVFFILTIIVFSIAAITAIFGRLWCGWACPQTVYIDAIYRKIEELIEGNARRRKELDRAPWTFKKIFQRSLKWLLFTLISIHLAHSFLGYFIPIRTLFAITQSPPSENPSAFIFMMASSALFFFNFAWFREQFCVIVCPYGRFQSVMMDASSLVVGYNLKRGEPRRSPLLPKEEEGDCINCFKCVRVCPTGIDIRRGTQMECIACTACIDACDEIMDKIHKPRGLISYTSEEIIAGKKWTLLRARPLIYFSFLFILTLVFVTLLNSQENLSTVYVHGHGPPFSITQDQEGKEIITNHFEVQINYRPENNVKADFALEKNWQDKMQIISPRRPFILKHGKNTISFFIRTSSQYFKQGRIPLAIKIIDTNNKILNQSEIKLVGP